MFDDIIGKIGGKATQFDPRKMVDLIDGLWDSRKKIVSAVDFVWDNKEAIGDAIDFMRDHADDLIDLGKRLPGFLANAGEALEKAGDGANTASLMLLGEDGQGMHDLAADAAAALERCRDELWAVMGLFDRAGTGLASLPVVGDVAQPLIDSSGRIGSVADDLGAVARKFRSLGDQLTGAGTDLAWVGDSLGTSGVALQRFAPTAQEAPDYFFAPATSSRPPSPKRPSGKQPSKPAAKRSPTKRTSKK